MNPVEPVDPRVRLAIVQWAADAPRGSVSTFCAEHGISRKTFYEIRKRVVIDGPAAALDPRSRRPKQSPSKLTDDVAEQAIGIRAALERSGLDHGPISVHEKMRALGITPVPSTASLARIFRAAGVARVEPRKKPRASYRRFVYPAPNACWQLDGTEYVLSGGRKCVIFQLIDDHSRYAVASHVAWGETSEGAMAVVSNGIAAHGVPQRLLSDNGAALNPSRRGVLTQRPHQALPGRITPLRAWTETPKVDAPRPVPQTAVSLAERDELSLTRIRDNGTVYARGIRFGVSRTLAGTLVHRVEKDDRLMILDPDETLIVEYPWPPPGTKYVGSGRSRGPRGPRKPEGPSPMS